MKEQVKSAVAYWLSAMNQHRHETNEFSVVVGQLTDDELTRLKIPSDWFIDFAPFMFRAVAPKHHPELRSAIAYLAELKYRQQEAWQRDFEKSKTRGERIAAWIEKHGTRKTTI